MASRGQARSLEMEWQLLAWKATQRSGPLSRDLRREVSTLGLKVGWFLSFGATPRTRALVLSPSWVPRPGLGAPHASSCGALSSLMR